MNNVLCRGIDNWTEEELSDPNKKLYYTNAQLERDKGRYKCLGCPHSSSKCRDMVIHISKNHPKFIHKNVPVKTNSRVITHCGLNIWTKEELSDPNKNVYYSRSDLKMSGGKHKCFCCPYDTPFLYNVIRHISCRHLRFLLKPGVQPKSKNSIYEKKYPRRGIETWTKEEVADPKKILIFTNRDLEKVDGKFKCFVCSFSNSKTKYVCRHIGREHPKFVLKEVLSSEPRSNEDNSVCGTSNSDNAVNNKEKTKKKSKKRKANSFPTCLKRRSLYGESSSITETPITTKLVNNHISCDEEMMGDDINHSLNDAYHSKNKTIENNETRERSLQENELISEDANERVAETHDYLLDNRDNENSVDWISSYTFHNSYGISDDHSDDHNADVLLLQNQQSTEGIESLVFPNENGASMNKILKVKEQPCGDVHTNEPCGINEQNQMENIVSIEFPDFIEIDSAENEDSVRGPAISCSCKDKNVLLLSELQLENFHLAASIESLKAKYGDEIAQLKETINRTRTNDVDLNQMLIVKEEMQNITGSYAMIGQSELLRQMASQREKYESEIAAKDKEFKVLKSENEVLEKHLELECEKVKESKQGEEELTKRLIDAESELATCKRLIELREEADRLQQEEELEKERARRFNQESEIILESKKLAKEAVMREVEKMKTCL